MKADRRKTLIFLYSFPCILAASSFFVHSPSRIAAGMGRILVSPSLLLTDYIVVGGLGAALLNAGLCGIICSFFVSRNKVEINGPFIAAVYTVMGFAFFGKNIFNIWPVLGGVYLFSLYQKEPYRNNLLVALFGTTLAPLISFFSFSAGLGQFHGAFISVLLGLAGGFILPQLASHMLRFHDGYNIYNVGFTGGIIGSFIIANMRSFGFEVEPVHVLGETHDAFFKLFLGAAFFMLAAGGVLISKYSSNGLPDSIRKINRSTGRLVSDFVAMAGYPATFVNMGILGFISILFVVLLGAGFNGPVVGGIFTVVGFGAFGKHARNCVPVLSGVAAASLVNIWEPSATGVVIAGLFGTTLAPVAGQYGFFPGLIAGFFHLAVVMNVGFLHGGVNLYNNGFAGGFVASLLVPVMDFIKRRGEEKDDV